MTVCNIRHNLLLFYYRLYAPSLQVWEAYTNTHLYTIVAQRTKNIYNLSLTMTGALAAALTRWTRACTHGPCACIKDRKYDTQIRVALYVDYASDQKAQGWRDGLAHGARLAHIQSGHLHLFVTVRQRLSL